MPSERYRGVSRRAFVKSAVAIGGTSALSACLARERELVDDTETATSTADPSEFPRGKPPSSLPTRQHAWDRYLVRNAHGNTILPSHQ